MPFVKIRKGTLYFMFFLLFILANSPLTNPERIRTRGQWTYVIMGILAVHIVLTNRKLRTESTGNQPEPIREDAESLYEKRSRHIPVKSQRIAWARFLLAYYADPGNEGKPLRKREYEFDHYIPFSQGGTHDSENIQVLPRKENREKGAKMPDNR